MGSLRVTRRRVSVEIDRRVTSLRCRCDLLLALTTLFFSSSMLGLSQRRLQCAAARACSTCCWPVTFDGLRRPQKGHRWPKEKMRPGGPADGDLECPARFRFPLHCTGMPRQISLPVLRPGWGGQILPPIAKNATLCNASLRAGTIITARISAPARRRAGGKKHNKLSHGIGHAMPLAPHATTTRSLRGNLNGPRRPKCGKRFPVTWASLARECTSSNHMCC